VKEEVFFVIFVEVLTDVDYSGWDGIFKLGVAEWACITEWTIPQKQVICAIISSRP
jgi:hypothetical protein